MTDVKIKCDSCKFVDGCVDYGWSECKKFTQKPSEPITNEEWLHTLTTEQLAEFLACVEAREYANYDEETKAFIEWLKQPHTVKE